MTLNEAQRKVLCDYLAPLLSEHIKPGKPFSEVLREVAEELSGRSELIAKIVQKHVYRKLYELVPRGDA